jgi:predicted RecA/RadA family phage recombinase
MVKVYIEKHYNDVAYITNSLGRDVQGGEFVVIGQLSGVVDRDTKKGDNLGLQIEPFMEIQVGKDDLVNPPANNYAEGGALYFNQTTGKFADAAGSGFVAVGQIARNRLDDGGIITFFKYPLAVS